jgi:hypothetical protein
MCTLMNEYVSAHQHAHACAGCNIAQVYSESPQPNPYTKKTFRTPLKYTGNLKAKDIDKFIQSKMHHTVIRYVS